MIDDDRFAAASAPRLNPESYPGAWPERSVLVTATGLWEIRDRDGVPFAADDPPRTRLGLCRVAVDDDTRKQVTDGARTAPQLSRVLEGLHVVGMDARVPVLAIGSNAAPAQLRHKFLDTPDALVLPSVRARVDGIALAYAGFFAGYGALPATIVPGSASVDLHVQFTDAVQLANLDRTEAPHYRRVWLDESSGVTIRLETGERLPGVYAYVARGGALADEDGQTIAAAMRPTDPGLSQCEVVDRLLDNDAIATAWGADAAVLRARAGAAPDGGADVLTAAGMIAAPSMFTQLADESGQSSARTYGRMLAGAADIPPAPAGRLHLVTTVTPAGIARGGKSVLSVSELAYEQLGRADVVEVRSQALVAGHGPAAPSAVAAVVVRTSSADAAPDHVVELDHVLRMACGLENGEVAEIRPVRLDRGTAGDRVVGKPTYLTMRTTLADPASAERDVVLMSRLALDILGVGPGDYVVVEGASTGTGDAPDGEIPTVMLKAFEAPSTVEETRQRITGGTWGARFPAAEETLGVRPDLPLAFLDFELRTRLGIAGQTLATVRVRPARLPQFWSELREMLLILAVAFLGVVVVAPWPWLQVLLIGALLAMSLWLILQRLRRRLTHVLRRGNQQRRR